MKLSAIHLLLSVGLYMSGFALTEEEYHSKYAFAVEADTGNFLDHPDSEYRVFTRYGIRECDADGGNVVILAFYNGDKLIRSYSLNQLFPDRKDWEFHRATGVFLWIMFNPKVNGIHEENFSALTVSGVQTFALRTGDRIEEKKHNKP